VLTVGLMSRDRGIRRSITAALLAALAWVSLIGAACGQADERKFDFDIQEETLEAALEAIVKETKLVVLYPNELAQNRDINPVIGRYTVREAIDELFRSTFFSGGLTENGVIYISHSGTETSDREAEMNSGEIKKTLLAGAAAFLYGTGAYAADVALIGEGDDACASGEYDRGGKCKGARDTIVVTGTNIRGVQNPTTPVQTFTRGDIDKGGYGSLPQFFESLPQNLASASQNTVGLSASDGTVNNSTYGSGVSLRGLGPQSSLVLLNGRRLTPAGYQTNFSDISMVPLSAIARVDVLTDGASAIYGSDAIGGVVNFITRKDFDGGETRLRYGTVTEGDREEITAGQTFGKSWGSGTALVSYEFSDKTSLSLQSKSKVPNSATLPYNQQPIDLLPDETRHSILANIQQEVTHTLETYLTGLYSSRSTHSFSATGLPSYSELRRDNDALTLNGGASLGLGAEHYLSIDMSYAKSTDDTPFSYTSSSNYITESNTQYNIWSAALNFSGPLWEYGAGTASFSIGVDGRIEDYDYLSQTTYLSTGVLGTPVVYTGHRKAAAVYAEVLIPVLDSDREGIGKVEISLADRQEFYEDFGSTNNPKFGIAWSPTDTLTLRGSWGTSFRAPTLYEAGLPPSSISVYPFPDVGGAITNVLLIGGGGKPLDPETAKTISVGFDFAPDNSTRFSMNYFNIEHKGRILSNPTNGIGFFNVLLQEEIVGPEIVKRNVPQSDIFATIAAAQAIGKYADYEDYFGIDPSMVSTIIDYRQLNLSNVKTSGIDFSGYHRFETGFGEINLSLTGTKLFKYTSQYSESAPLTSSLNRPYQPIDLKLRGQASLRAGDFTASMALNYVDSYTDPRPLTVSAPVDEWTTVDLIMTYSILERGSALSDLTFSVGVNNLLDEAPPFVETNFSPGNTTSAILNLVNFDGVNHNALGRFVYFQLQKKF